MSKSKAAELKSGEKLILIEALILVVDLVSQGRLS
jgi:hypothetical protein